MRRSQIAVVGSINLDVSVPVPHLPLPGETVLGDDALWSPGGKGANQAVAAARLDCLVSMVGAVGTDAAGDDMLRALEVEGIDFEGSRLEDVPTGLAVIMVATSGDAAGENSIAVSSGANAHVTAAMVAASESVRNAAVVLTQFEIPLDAVATAIASARGKVIVNPAPVPDVGSPSDLARAIEGAHVLVPNQGELAQLAGAARASSRDELIDQARSLAVDSVVVTLGGDGALVVTGSEVTTIPTVPVPVVDTTAAGDAFCGGLADALAGGSDLVAAAHWAARVAAVAVTRRGAQASLGTRADVLALAQSAS